MNKLYYCLVLTTFLGLFCSDLKGQDFEVVYLTIGSRHYTPRELCGNCYSFDELEGAVKSADYVGKFFQKYAKANGIKLFSRIEPHYKYYAEPILLSKESIYAHVDTLARMIKEKKKNIKSKRLCCMAM